MKPISSVLYEHKHTVIACSFFLESAGELCLNILRRRGGVRAPIVCLFICDIVLCVNCWTPIYCYLVTRQSYNTWHFVMSLVCLTVAFFL